MNKIFACTLAVRCLQSIFIVFDWLSYENHTCKTLYMGSIKINAWFCFYAIKQYSEHRETWRKYLLLWNKHQLGLDVLEVSAVFWKRIHLQMMQCVIFITVTDWNVKLLLFFLALVIPFFWAEPFTSRSRCHRHKALCIFQQQWDGKWPVSVWHHAHSRQANSNAIKDTTKGHQVKYIPMVQPKQELFTFGNFRWV